MTEVKRDVCKCMYLYANKYQGSMKKGSKLESGTFGKKNNNKVLTYMEKYSRCYH